MPDFLLELRSEEIPARMQAKARADLERLFVDELGKVGLAASGIRTFATPRRLALIARDLPEETQAGIEERRGPRVDAPQQAIEGFAKSAGVRVSQLQPRDDKKGTFLYAVAEHPGLATAALLAEAVPAIIRAFPWPKSMRWGAASASTESPRWVRPLQGIVALFGEKLVPVEAAGVHATAWTLGHRVHHSGPITLGGAHDYEAKLRACHVILDSDERARIITEGARALAAERGLQLVEDEALAVENAGLTEWPVPLLGAFDPAFLQVPREVIQLTMRTNQKYFSLLNPPRDGEVAARSADGGGAEPGAAPSNAAQVENPLHHPASPDGPPPRPGEDFELAPAFVCVANLDASDSGVAITRGNERVLAARLADARFFWEGDLKVPLDEQAGKLGQIVFHEKLGTVADKVERVARLARWLVEEGIVKPLPFRGGEEPRSGEGVGAVASNPAQVDNPHPNPSPEGEGLSLADLAERAARLCKADLVTGTVGEFPEVQGIAGGHLALAGGEHPAVAAAIRDHYKPVGQGDEVPTDPVTVAVSLADKLDNLASMFAIGEVPTGSKDPFALRRAAISTIRQLLEAKLRTSLSALIIQAIAENYSYRWMARVGEYAPVLKEITKRHGYGVDWKALDETLDPKNARMQAHAKELMAESDRAYDILPEFMIDRLKVQQREAGVRHDLIDAVFALGGEDDLVRLLARVRALQGFMGTEDGANLHIAYKRAANILKKEGWGEQPYTPRGEGQPPQAAQGEGESGTPGDGMTPSPLAADAALPSPRRGEEVGLSYTPLPEEQSLITALDSAQPRAKDAMDWEEFEAAMSALASLRAPIDAFFDKVTVNDPDPDKRAARLALLARFRDAVHSVADFSRIEGHAPGGDAA